LTDSVTNLVGALILLIVLFVGVTQQRVAVSPVETIPDSAGAKQREQADATLGQLLKQVALLRAQTVQFRQQCAAIRGEVDELRKNADEILNSNP